MQAGWQTFPFQLEPFLLLSYRAATKAFVRTRDTEIKQQQKAPLERQHNKKSSTLRFENLRG
jgi:hypothetical protein